MVLDAASLHALSGSKGESVRVAILDSGIDLSHPHFQNLDIRVKDFVNPGSTGNDFEGHGTHCSGIITAIAPACTLFCGVIRSTFFVYPALVSAMAWAIEEAADIICICSGETYEYPGLHELIQEAVLRRNIVVVAAIGNRGLTGLRAGYYPAVYKEAIAVGAVDDQGKLADFTELNPEVPMVCTPGVDIRSAWLEGQVRECSGTSCSAAYLTGILTSIVSKMKIQRKKIEASTIMREIIRSTSGAVSERGPYNILDISRLF